MIDYLFLKLSEMALRAIRVPTRYRWVFYSESTYGGMTSAFKFTKMPISIAPWYSSDVYFFRLPPDTVVYDCSNGEISNAGVTGFLGTIERL